MRPVSPGFASLLLALLASPLAAQVEVSAIGLDLEPISATEEIRHFRYEEGVELASLEVAAELAVGDLLTALVDELFLELTCPEGSLLRFTGRFMVQINPILEGEDCAVDFMDGALDVLTDGETEVCTGGVCLGTGGTRYGLRLDRAERAATRRVVVFDGGVAVGTVGGEAETVTAKEELVIRPAPAEEETEAEVEAGPYTRPPAPLPQQRRRYRRPIYPRIAAPAAPAAAELVFERRTIDDEQIERWAGLYARFDVVKARAAGIELDPGAAEAEKERLKTLHAAVMREPEKPEARAELADAQVENRIDREALYNAKRSGLATPEALELYQIDPSRLRRGSAEDRERLKTLIRENRPSLSDRQFLVIDALSWQPAANSPPAEIERYWRRWVERQQTARRRGDIDARGYVILARALAALDDARRGAEAARRALELDETARQLTERELAACRELASGG